MRIMGKQRPSCSQTQRNNHSAYVDIPVLHQHPSLSPIWAHKFLTHAWVFLSLSHTRAPLGVPKAANTLNFKLLWSPYVLHSLSVSFHEGYLALAEKAEANGDEGNK